MGQQDLEPPLLLPPERLLVGEELPLEVLLGRGVEGRRHVPEDDRYPEVPPPLLRGVVAGLVLELDNRLVRDTSAQPSPTPSASDGRLPGVLHLTSRFLGDLLPQQ